MAEKPKPPQLPPDKERLLEVWRRSVPDEFSRPLLTGGEGGGPHESYALFRALAAQWAALVKQGNRSVQARFHLTSTVQTDVPASSARPASGYVTLERTGPTEDAIEAVPGAIGILGPGGRRYINAETVVWNPGDTLPRKVRFVADTQGFAGNLDFLANEDGTVDLEHLSIEARARGRAAVEGKTGFSAQSFIEDSGLPDLFEPSDVGLYVRVDVSGVPSNVGQVRRIVGHEAPQVENPPGSGRYPTRVLVDDLIRRNPSEVVIDDGGVFADYYAQAIDETGQSDVPLAPTPPAVGDAVMFGYAEQFSEVELRIDTPGEGDWTVVWEFWDGLSWSPFQANVIDDPTSGFRPAEPGTYTVKFELPLAWQTIPSPVSGIPLYFVRARYASVVSVTTEPAAGRVVVKQPLRLAPDGPDPNTGAVKWTLLDYSTGPMGLQIVESEAFTGGRDDDLYLLGDARGVYRQPGESDDAFRERVSRLAEVVSPNAILSAVNRLLRPLGYKGKVADVTLTEGTVGGGFAGLFCDVDPDLAPDYVGALDLYAPGDLYPQKPWFVLQDAMEAYGWFLVELPYLGAGDFGIFCDEGPLYFDDVVNVYYGPAFTGWCDGYPIDGNAVYAAIWSVVNRIRAGGVGFTMVRERNLTQPGAC